MVQETEQKCRFWYSKSGVFGLLRFWYKKQSESAFFGTRKNSGVLPRFFGTLRAKPMRNCSGFSHLESYIWKLLFVSANPNDKGISRFGLFWAAPLGSLTDVGDIINVRDLGAFLFDRKTERVAAFAVLPEVLARELVLDLRLPAIVKLV